MSLRADRYRQRAEDAKHRAAQAKDPSIKSAFEHVAAGWVALAEQVERIDAEKFPLREEENSPLTPRPAAFCTMGWELPQRSLLSVS